MWFSSWSEIGRVVLSAAVTYVLLIGALRIAGKRTIASMNVSDFVVTIALGSAVATTILDTQLAIATGLSGIGALVLLQLVTTWLTTRFETARKAVEASPTLVVYRGRLLDDAMRRQNVNESEILHALRENGAASLQDVHAVVLEIDGDLSVLPEKPKEGQRSVLRDVAGKPR